ncbi:MAG: hypothetical protein ACI4UK_01370 [Floccifex sp.]
MKYSKEFKEEALKLSDEVGLKKAAQQLGIQYYTLSEYIMNLSNEQLILLDTLDYYSAFSDIKVLSSNNTVAELLSMR